MKLAFWGGIAVVCVAVIGGLVICRNPPPPSQVCKGVLGRPLRVGIVTWPGYVAGIVANRGFKPNRDSLFFKRHKLCVQFRLIEEFEDRRRALEDQGADGVDVVWSTVDSWAYESSKFLEDNVKAKVIMQVDWSRGGDAIVAAKNIQRIEDLYGKKISLVKFTPSHWLLEFSLQNSGLNPARQDEIEGSLIGKDSSLAARADFVSNKSDAAVVWEPDVTEALEERPDDSHILVDTNEATMKKLIADVMVAREDFISNHSEAIAAFVAGWVVDGTREANGNLDDAAKLLMENELVYRNLGPDRTRETLRKVKLSDLADNNEMFNLDQRQSQPLFDDLYSKAARRWIARKYIASYVPPSEVKDASFIRNVYEKYYGAVLPRPALGSAVVTFEVGDDKLSTTAREIIDEKIAAFTKTPLNYQIRVEGNTDASGGLESNQTLSIRRAEEVTKYLIKKHHFSLKQFVTVGNGPNKPIAPNTTPEGMASNRRVEIRIENRSFGPLP